MSSIRFCDKCGKPSPCTEHPRQKPGRKPGPPKRGIGLHLTPGQDALLDALRGSLTRSNFIGCLIEAADAPNPGEAIRVLRALADRG